MKYSRNKGFTLVETLVAVAVLLLAIVGPMVVAARGFQAAYFAREKMAAVFLAQEAIEVIEKLRDDQALHTVWTNPSDGTWDWFTSVVDAQCRNAARTCGYNPLANNPGEVFRVCSGSNCRLNENTNPTSNNVLYGFGSGGSWIESKYTREITFDQEVNSQELMVTVEVTWPANVYGSYSGDASVVLQTRIFNQYD